MIYVRDERETDISFHKSTTFFHIYLIINTSVPNLSLNHQTES